LGEVDCDGFAEGAVGGQAATQILVEEYEPELGRTSIQWAAVGGSLSQGEVRKKEGSSGQRNNMMPHIVRDRKQLKQQRVTVQYWWSQCGKYK
jgi:hypothetical protein